MICMFCQKHHGQDPKPWGKVVISSRWSRAHEPSRTYKGETASVRESRHGLSPAFEPLHHETNGEQIHLSTLSCFEFFKV